MKRFLVQTISLTLLLLCTPASPFAQAPATMQSAYGEKIHVAGVPNAGKINEHFYRGAQPAMPALAKLKALGVTTVVNLRSEASATIAAERQQAESLGLQFVNIPVDGFSAPTNGQVIQFLSLFRDHPQEVIFVHCHYGEDRTGVFVASYRMAVDRWPETQARKEMDLFGFHRHWQHKMAAYVQDFPARMTAAPDLGQFLKVPPSSATAPTDH